ncbi:MAG: adenylate/guanylate cyclase domain-containing protein [Candidatus Dormibacteraceae bacterium]
MSGKLHDALEASGEAMRRHDWLEARRVLTGADAAGKLDAEGLRQLGKAHEWCQDIPAALDAFERSYATFVAAGDRPGAAKVALMLRHLCSNMLRDTAAARGWLQRAQHLLEGEKECAEHGFLWRAQGRTVFIQGDADAGLTLLKKAIELGRRLGDTNLVAMSMTWLGISLCEIGRRDEASAYLDEACAAAVGGELGPWATGIVYCNSIGAYRDVGELALAGEWTQTAGRWCHRESITGFSGICRVHRAEFMRLRGAWADAEKEARVASGELEGNVPSWAGEAHYEIGEIRLRLGDLAGAEEAFRRAHELARDPQPGGAMLLAAQGELAAALRSLETTNPSGVLDEMRCLSVKVDIACALGELETADAAAQKAEALAAEHRGLGVQVLAVQAVGTLQLARRDLTAHKTLRQALRMWQEIDAPYEVAQVRMLLARALGQIGDSSGARREGEAALAAFEKLGAAPDVVRAKLALEEAADARSAPRVAERTLFFSDIVGSTQLVEAIGDEAWSGLVAWLDGTLRQCFAAHAGEEVDHAGDGFFVAFPNSTAALDCAVSIQRKLADHRREHGFAPRLRIGVHAATTSQGGGRYRGRGVHEASRIAALAGPDEVVASRATVPEGFTASAPREVSVKGISKPIELVTIDWRR